MNQLHKIWQKHFNYNWKFGLFLILLFGIPRFILVLQTNTGLGYGYVSLVFMIMWFTPLIFLTKNGRRTIGIKKPNHYSRLIYAFGAGVIFCAILFLISWLLYGYTISNSFVYIPKAYTMPGELSDSVRFQFFIISAIPAMIFSPIGEELFYRGVIHGSFVSQFGENKASIFDSLAFAFTHLAHFGIIYNEDLWDFLPLPSLFWIVSMFLASQVFFRCKLFCDSVLGAILSHAGYNFAMMYFIFYHVL